MLRSGSLSGAARDLTLSQPTLGRHIAELEEALGLALFTRSPGGLVATEEALRLRPGAEALEFSVQELLTVARAGSTQGDCVGTVRITASEAMGTHVLPPILASLQHDNAGLAIELRLSNQVDDLLRRDADIALRTQRPSQGAIVTKKVGSMRLGLFAHRQYIERFGAPTRASELKKHLLVGFDEDRSRGGTTNRGGPSGLLRSDFRYRTDNLLAQNAAVRAGVGIGALQYRLATDDPNLVPVLPKAVQFIFELWIAMHEDQRQRAPVRHVFDGLAVGLARWCAQS